MAPKIRQPACRRASAGAVPCASRRWRSRRTRAASGFSLLRLVQLGDRLHRRIEQADQVGEGVAEEPGDPQRHVDPRAVQQGDREYLEIGDALAAGLPDRSHAEQGQGLGDVVAAGAHGRRAPHRETELAQVIAMFLQVTLEQQVGRLEADAPGGRGRQVAHVHREEVASGGQHVESPATRRAARTGRYEAPFEGCQQPVDLGPATGVQGRCHLFAQAAQHLAAGTPGGRRRFAAQAAFYPVQRQQFQAFAGIPESTPGLPAPLFQAGRPRALPGLAHVAGQRIEAQAKVVRQALQQPGVGALAIAARNPQQRQQGIQAQSPARRLAEHMQAVADLRLLQVAEIGVQLRQPAVRIVAELQADLAVETVVAQEDENLAAQLFGAARVEQRGIVELVGQALQVAQRAVALGAGQRRHQVVDDHRLGAALGLGALPGSLTMNG